MTVNIPAGWTVTVSASDPEGCNRTLTDPSRRIRGRYGKGSTGWQVGSNAMPSEQACIDHLIARAEK